MRRIIPVIVVVSVASLGWAGLTAERANEQPSPNRDLAAGAVRRSGIRVLLPVVEHQPLARQAWAPISVRR